MRLLEPDAGAGLLAALIVPSSAPAVLRHAVTTQRERRRVRARQVRRRRKAAAAVLALVVVVAGGLASVWTSPGRGSLSPHVAARRSSPKAVVRRVAPFTAPRVAPLVHPALRGEGIWQPAELQRHRLARRPRHHVPDRSSRRHGLRGAGSITRGASSRCYPGLSEPPLASPRAARPRCRTASGGGSWRRSTAASSTTPAPAASRQRAGRRAAAGGSRDRRRVSGSEGSTSSTGTGMRPSDAGLRPAEPAAARKRRPRPNPTAGELWRWGVTIGHYAQVWRTALGIDRHGVLLYAAADGQTARRSRR